MGLCCHVARYMLKLWSYLWHLEKTLPQYSNLYNSKAYGTPIFFMDSKVF